MLLQNPRDSSSPLISPLYFFFPFSSLQTLFLRSVCVKDVNIRGRTRTRHLSFPRFYSRRLILNRGSQGRLRNPARHCEDANQFSSRGSFSRSFHRAGTKREGGKKEGTDPRATCVRIERMCIQICYCGGLLFLLLLSFFSISSRFSSRFPICTSLSSGMREIKKKSCFFKKISLREKNCCAFNE